MKLLKLNLLNFKGIKEFTLDANGDDVFIYGDNATGKTTLFDALCWLLFGRDSADRTDFGIKTIGSDGKEIHNLSHSVSAVFELDGGKTVELSRVYKEVWSKKRGATTEQLTSHTTDYTINGVPKKDGEYKEFIENLIPIKVFKLLTNPFYFNEVMSWQDRRSLLMEIVGDVSAEDVIASDKSLANLNDHLKDMSLDEYRSVISSNKKTIRKELDELPGRIDEAYRFIKSHDEIDEAAIQSQLDELSAKMEALRKKKAILENGMDSMESIAKVQLIESKIKEYVAGFDSLNKANELSELINVKEKSIASAKTSVTYLNEKLQELSEAYRNHEENIVSLRNKFNDVASQKFDDSLFTATTCKYCGQPLPLDQQEELLNKAKGDFLEKQAKDKAAVRAEGLRLKELMESTSSYMAKYREDIESFQNDIESMTAEVQSLQLQLEECKTADPYSTEEYASMVNELELAKDDVEMSKANRSHLILQCEDDIGAATNEYELVLAKKSEAKHVEEVRSRIAVLEARAKELGEQLSDVEADEFMVERFIITKVGLLEKKINSAFSMARFKMFDVQMNGGIKECCETIYDNIPYRSLNNAAKINIGLDIINTMTKHYKFTAPVFIDNAESVTSFNKINSQMVYLFVKSGANQLEIQYSDNLNAK